MLMDAHSEKLIGRRKYPWTPARPACYSCAMDWKAFFILFAKAALQVLADELDPANRRRRPGEEAPEPKQAPTPPRAEASAPQAARQATPQAARQAAPKAAPQSTESAGWGACTEPQAVTVLRVETDQGSAVSPVSFIGSEHYAPVRVQRERKPGESRRVRRSPPVDPAILAQREELRKYMRERMLARINGTAPVVLEQPAAPPRRRQVGAMLTIANLTPDTLRLLASGESPVAAAT